MNEVKKFPNIKKEHTETVAYHIGVGIGRLIVYLISTFIFWAIARGCGILFPTLPKISFTTMYIITTIITTLLNPLVKWVQIKGN